MKRYPTFVTIKNPPKQFELSVSDIAKLNSLDNHSETRRQLEIFSKDLPLLTRNFDGEIRYCNICNCIKPDRCHHCSICGQCVLKMDHHCPWINNCVGYSNYKFFVLFLFYAFVYCLWVTSTTMKYFIKFWTNNLPDGGGKFHILFVFFTSSMFALSVSSLLFYHLWLTSKNRSTLESFRAPIFATAGPDANGFNLGWRENFKEIFGNDKFLALLPIRTSRGDGSSYPSRVYHRLASRTSQLPNSSVTNQSFNENNISNNSNSNKRDGGDSPVHPNHHNNNNNNNYENSLFEMDNNDNSVNKDWESHVHNGNLTESLFHNNQTDQIDSRTFQ
ncbi:hypothetical protein SNEBB_008863 [Seison nebaliae]|nr:hypothetical protein SNEBB_008863 [Seison nebaliae]